MTESTHAGARRPLNDTLVVEMGSSVAGPFGAWILSQLGASVYKVEDYRGGDASRSWGPANCNGNSAVYEIMNHGKRSVAADLTDPDQQQTLRRFIIDKADVVMQNLRPGFAARCRLGQQELVGLKPSLVYCDLGAYGKGGPLEQLPGYDPLIQAFSGLAAGTGSADTPSRVAAPVNDFLTGMWAAIAILAALKHRGQSGRGAQLDVSLLESGISLMSIFAGIFQSQGTRPVRRGLEGPLVAPNGGFSASDGLIVIVCGTDALFHKLCTGLGCEQWLGDPRFATIGDRYSNRAALKEELEKVLIQRPRSHWIELLEAAEVPCAPVHEVDEMMAHPQTLALQMFEALPQSPFQAARLPIRIDGDRPAYETPGPSLGQHNAEVGLPPVNSP